MQPWRKRGLGNVIITFFPRYLAEYRCFSEVQWNICHWICGFSEPGLLFDVYAFLSFLPLDTMAAVFLTWIGRDRRIPVGLRMPVDSLEDYGSYYFQILGTIDPKHEQLLQVQHGLLWFLTDYFFILLFFFCIHSCKWGQTEN